MGPTPPPTYEFSIQFNVSLSFLFTIGLDEIGRSVEGPELFHKYDHWTSNSYLLKDVRGGRNASPQRLFSHYSLKPSQLLVLFGDWKVSENYDGLSFEIFLIILESQNTGNLQSIEQSVKRGVKKRE
eukprot:TRINITY_DN6163_c0_g4_i1.p1 TRINITY_DN6163_c0_g4~~TRINITY_DN6163_c0_g4_i1.p1  ORF type:complete len:127 (+),score=23.97 TRINITY_DN6163_c0_g4_i1:339-719(+)